MTSDDMIRSGYLDARESVWRRDPSRRAWVNRVTGAVELDLDLARTGLDAPDTGGDATRTLETQHRLTEQWAKQQARDLERVLFGPQQLKRHHNG